MPEWRSQMALASANSNMTTQFAGYGGEIEAMRGLLGKLDRQLQAVESESTLRRSDILVLSVSLPGQPEPVPWRMPIPE